MPNGLEKIFANFKRIVVVEMNDQGIYGFGQLATILRARYCDPKIESLTKTDGLTYRVKEILEGVFVGRTWAARRIPDKDRPSCTPTRPRKASSPPRKSCRKE